MTDTNDATGRNFLAEARENLKANVSEQTDYEKAGREVGKAFARGLFGKFADRNPRATASSVLPKSAGRSMSRFAKGMGFFFAVFFCSIALVFVNGWLATGLIVFSILVCFSRRLKGQGISIFVGLLLLLIALPFVLVGWSVETQKVALAPLRQSNPTAYLENARGVLSREKWLEETKLLAPERYQSELTEEEVTRLAENTRNADAAWAAEQERSAAAWREEQKALKPPRPEVTALNAMTKLFRGGYSQDQIELETVTVLRLFERPVTEANLERLGSQMLMLQKNIHPKTEMDLLRCMRDAKRDAYDTTATLEMIAAMCATTFQMGL